MGDLVTFARRLMRINEKVARSNTPTAIFGSIGDLPQAISHRANYRIGLWPCVSEEKPELAMGLWSALAHLLERWHDIQVYRLFVKFEEEYEDFEWSMEKSQFTVEDWELEPLDENIGIWGELKQEGDSWQLSISIDNDMLTGEDSEPEDLSISAPTATGLIAMLPDFAKLIAERIGAELIDDTDIPYPNVDYQETEALVQFLKQVLDWEVQLLAYFWDADWEDEDIETDFHELLDSGKAVQDDFAAWLASKSVAHTMRPGYSVIGDLLFEQVEAIFTTFPDSFYPVPIMAAAIYNMGFAPDSYRLLEDELKTHPLSQQAWLRLAELYAGGGHFNESLSHFQTAIEKDLANNTLYRNYGNVLLATDQYGIEVETFVLVDPDKYAEDSVIWEAIEAYEKALEQDSHDVRTLYAQSLQLILVDEELTRFWTSFDKLVALDTTGDYVREVVESLYDVEDISHAVDTLKSLLDKNPERIDIYINLAALYLLDEDGDSAETLLEKAQEMTEDLEILTDIERMLLSVDDPDFEQRFAELVSILDAGNAISSDDMEYLEEIVEDSPNFVEGQLAVARAYYIWDDTDEALEVLLSAQERLPDQPEILSWLARILWESGESELAFQYLNRGLQNYPFNVALLARTGQYLFDNGQLKAARAMLSRAEEISPRDPSLQVVRTYIAQKMASNPDLYEGYEDDELDDEAYEDDELDDEDD